MLTICLVARIYTLLHTENIAPDGAVLLAMAMRLTQAPAAAIHEFPQHPGYPALVALAAKVTSASWPFGWVAMAQITTIVMSLLAVGCLYGIAARLFDHSIALLTALLFGLSTEVSFLSADALSDMPALAWGLLSLLMALYAEQPKRRSSVAPALLGGLAGGLAYLTRPEYLLCPVLGAIVLLLARKRNWLGIGLYVGLCAALCAPYAVAIGALTHKKSLHDFVSSGSATVLTAGIGHDFYQLVKKLSEMTTPAPLVFLHVYVLARIASRFFPAIKHSTVLQPCRLQWLLVTPLLVLAPILLSMEDHLGPGYVSSRHVLLPAALLFTYSARGLVLLVELAALGLAKWNRPAAAPTAFLALLLIAIGSNMPRVIKPLHVGKGAFLQAGAKLMEQFGPGHYVLSSDARVAFFASCPLEQFTRGTDMPASLRAAGLKDVNSLRNLLSERKGRRYEFLAVDEKLMSNPAQRKVVDAVSDRLTPLFSARSSAKNASAVIVFGVRPEEQ